VHKGVTHLSFLFRFLFRMKANRILLVLKILNRKDDDDDDDKP
jgi:hypothetical protein